MIRLRYPAACVSCEAPLAKGVSAWWDPNARTVRCAGCVDPPPAGPTPTPRPEPEPTSGSAGASAQREFERRHAARERRILGRHPLIGKFILGVSSDPKTTTSWQKGADGERALGRRLDGCAGASVIVLHDLGVPGKSSNIDHVVVTPSHVFVIDAKQYSGEVRARDDGGLFDRDVRLRVGSRDCSKLVEASLGQAVMVGRALTGLSPAPRVVPVLCFVRGDWRLFARPLDIDGVVVTWPNNLAARVRTDGDGRASRATAAARAIAQVFRAA